MITEQKVRVEQSRKEQCNYLSLEDERIEKRFEEVFEEMKTEGENTALVMNDELAALASLQYCKRVNGFVGVGCDGAMGYVPAEAVDPGKEESLKAPGGVS